MAKKTKPEHVPPLCEVCHKRPGGLLDGQRKMKLSCGCETPLLVCAGCRRGNPAAFVRTLKRCTSARAADIAMGLFAPLEEPKKKRRRK